MRSGAIQELMEDLSEEAESARKVLKKVPDLERLLSRIHANGSKVRVTDHPDGRACMYENNIYNARKIRDFIDLLTGFESLMSLDTIFGEADVKSTLLRRVTRPPSGAASTGRMPFNDMRRILKHFRDIFDEAQAKRDGTIKPHKGMNAEYDAAISDVKEIEKSFETYLRDMKKDLGISELVYWGSGKDRYQIEVPMGQTNKVPTKWSAKSQKKSHRRYWTPYIEQKLAELTAAEERLIK
jgi:DNA mismatch repair protein MSH6